MKEKENIGFNKPYLTGKEIEYIQEAIENLHISGNGVFTKKCQNLVERKFGFQKALLTTSCTDALEMAAILIDIKPGDEVIVPSFTFVSTANAFLLRGAIIKFADSGELNPNITSSSIKPLITEKTKAIVVVHYAGIACDMDPIMKLAKEHNLFVIEDAAQAIDSYYKNRPLGSIGTLSAFSFHETKNIISGEGGMLVINDSGFNERAEVIWEKGTNRTAFHKGLVDKYRWIDIGSSFLPSELIAAFLYAQLESINLIQVRRKEIWYRYFNNLQNANINYKLPYIPDYATNNAHMFFLQCQNQNERDSLINFLKEKNIVAVFHYLSLHKSPYYKNFKNCFKHECPFSDKYSETIVRLPLYFDLKESEQFRIIESINTFYQ